MNSRRIDTAYTPAAEARKAHDVRIRKADLQDNGLLSHLIREAYRNVAEKFNLTPENRLYRERDQTVCPFAFPGCFHDIYVCR